MYVGRFAPSPTGPLHFGSLVAAVASYCEAKSKQGQWLVRMEDLDKPREIAGAAQEILNTLEAYSFEWHGEIMYQSQRSEAYQAALDQLKTQNLLYPCSCSRKEIADSASHGIDGLVYPGTCRHGMSHSRPQTAWRVNVHEVSIDYVDAIQGPQYQSLQRDIGDFVLKRADGLFAYQLAVVVDDAEQGITHIVRGADLLDSTPRQIYLQQLLNFHQPEYAHVPIATNPQGEKLSKQTLAAPINSANPPQSLFNALVFLGQNPPSDLNLKELWNWAITHWQTANIPRVKAIQV